MIYIYISYTGEAVELAGRCSSKRLAIEHPNVKVLAAAEVVFCVSSRVVTQKGCKIMGVQHGATFCFVVASLS